VVGLASDETCASIRQALPDVQSFEFQRPAEPVRIPKPTQPMPPPAGIEGVITNSIGMKLAWIGQGEFMMGSPNTESLRAGNEYYRHVRVADPFYLGVYEVTQEEYENVMGENPSYFSPGGQGGTALSGLDTRRFPADSVSWQDAAEFCRRLSARPEERAAGREYRLPTEVDWEYACRAGTTTPTHFGDSLSSAQANFDGDHPYSTTQKGPSLQRTTTAGSYTPNGFGLHNMHGNVCEWCVDWEGSYQHVYRGGSWADTGAACRAAAIRCAMPTQRDNRLGFRVVCETPGSQP